MGTNAVQGKPCFASVLCVCVCVCEHDVRAKLSILKSGQDRLALQASLSQCKSVSQSNVLTTDRKTRLTDSQADRPKGKQKHESRTANATQAEDVL